MPRVKVRVNGVVQGVGFRPFVYRIAKKHSLDGYVRNLGGAGVNIELEGKKKQINEFLEDLKTQNPPLSNIKETSVKWEKEKNISGFKIKESSEENKGTGSIPPDTAICEKCLKDIYDEKSRYHRYWATSCVDCGPRFTVIRELPYDRPNTSMEDFPMCEKCQEEYEDPMNRRHHAQTIACPNCGPELEITPKGKNEPIKEAQKRIKQEEILAIKGTGGTHIACLPQRDLIKKLRKKLNRSQQPFALMAPSIEKIKEFAKINETEKKLLESIRRPIVILEKKKNNSLPNNLAPRLHNIGTMLPYSGLHQLLFDEIDEPLIMTSANKSGIPMYIKNQEIKKNLKGVVDSFLLHNREIVQRCDDSVIRVQGNQKKFLRKSRGYAPHSLSLDLGTDEEILAIGAELDNRISLYNGEECYTSQYIGDVDNLETFNYLKESIKHLKEITNTSYPEKIVCDQHPGYRTTKYAKEIGNPIKVQHHHAHIASVLAEKGLKEDVIGIGIDGLGYGGDENIWGGEVLLANRERYEKLGGLSYQEMPGGDLATKYPARMLAGILYPKNNLSNFLKNYYFPQGEDEIDNLLTQLDNSLNVFKTSSAGRFLDAVSCLLHICEERTYEGEPSMKLEKVAKEGTSRQIELEHYIQDKYRVLNTKKLLENLISLKKNYTRKDVAATAQKALATSLSKLATDFAEEKNIDKVAISGGVAYNDMITRVLKKEIKKREKTPLMNEETPQGDGGLSLGQIAVASTKIN